MPHNLITVLESLGFFSSASPLTPQSTEEDVHAYVSLVEAGLRMIVSGSDAVTFADKLLADVDEELITIKGVDGNKIPVYINTPRDAAPTRAILYIHGGAMAMMRANDLQFRAWRRLLAKDGFLVAGVDFRNCSGMGTRCPFPGGLNDCVSALKWLVNLNEVTEVTVCGESGGANLTIATCVRAEKQGVTHNKIKGAVAIDPYIAGPSVWGGLKQSAFPSLQQNSGIGSPVSDWAAFGKLYTPNEADWKTGEAWPTFLTDEEIDLLPPMTIHTSDLDTLRDEGQSFARRLARAGKLVTNVNHMGSGHVTHLMIVNSELRCRMELAAKSVTSFAAQRK